MNTYMKGTIGLVTVSTCMVLVWGCTSDGLCCVGGGSTGKTVLVGPLTTEVIANGNDLKKGKAYYVDEPLYVEGRRGVTERKMGLERQCTDTRKSERH